MLKKFAFGCALILISSPVWAVTMKVEAITPFSTENPEEDFTVKVLEECKLSDSLVLESGVILHTKTCDIISPKRLKRDASFSVMAESYVDKNGETHRFEDIYKGKYFVPADKKDLAKNAALNIGSCFIKGLSLGVNAVEGAIKNEEGNRLKSSVKNIYDNSPISYIEIGEDITINAGETFNLNFKTDTNKEIQNLPNYEYTLPEEYYN